MTVQFLCDTFGAHASSPAIIWRDEVFTYEWMLRAFAGWESRLRDEGIPRGTIVSLEADFSPNAVALLLALLNNACTIVPLTTSVESMKPEFRDIAQVETSIEVDSSDRATVHARGSAVTHELLVGLKERSRPGLILFSSGSTGRSKAAVHDCVPLLEKFKTPRHCYRTLTFLLFDHIGGVNTLLYTLANAGCIVTVQDRSPESVCAAIERHKVELLPTSPTFLNLLLVSEAYRRFDLSSLKMVTYGTEVMPESTLRRLNELFPNLRLLQTYGLSEVGILRSKSRSSDSLWLKIGGEGFETRVVDGLLEIKAASAMLGYLNAPSPFTEDGWFKTGDAVDVDGEYMRIKGRTSELINVGGEKVYPAEVESVIQLLDGVREVLVRGEPNRITGQMVTAIVRLGRDEPPEAFRRRLREFCRPRLARFKIPQKIEIVNAGLHGERFKKQRRTWN